MRAKTPVTAMLVLALFLPSPQAVGAFAGFFPGPLEQPETPAGFLEWILPTGFRVLGTDRLRGTDGVDKLVATARAAPGINSSGPKDDGVIALWIFEYRPGGALVRVDLWGAQSAAAPVAVDLDHEGHDEVVVWAGGRFMVFDDRGTALVNVTLEMDANPFAPTPPPAARSIANGSIEFAVAGRNGTVYMVAPDGSIRWRTHLADHALAGAIAVIDCDSDGRDEVLLAEGSWVGQLEHTQFGFSFEGNRTFLLDAADGSPLQTVTMEGRFPPVPGSSQDPPMPFVLGAPGGVPRAILSNASGGVFRLVLGRSFVQLTLALDEGRTAQNYALCGNAGAGHADLLVSLRGAPEATLKALDLGGELWSAQLQGAARSIAATPSRGDPMGCEFLIAANRLELFSGANGSVLESYEIGNRSVATAAVLDLDGDGWGEVVADGINMAIPDPQQRTWIGVFDRAPLPISGSGPSGGPVVVYGGAALWTPLALAVNGVPANLSITRIDLTIGASVVAPVVSFDIANGSLAARTAATMLTVCPACTAYSRIGTGFTLSTNLTAAWEYGGNRRGSLFLWLDVTNRSPVRIALNMTMAVLVEIGSAVDLRRGTGGAALAPGEWVGPLDQLRFFATPPFYLGDGAPVPASAFVWNHTAVGSVNLTQSTSVDGGLSAAWRYPGGGGSGWTSLLRASILAGNRSLWSWNGSLAVDPVAPSMGARFPAGGRVTWISTNRADMGLVVCDNESGATIGAIRLEGAGAPLPYEVVLAVRGVGGPSCTSILLRATLAMGITTVNLTLFDAVGNSLFVTDAFAIGVDTSLVTFDSFSPTNWSNQTDVAASVHLVDQGGAGVNLSSIAWAYGSAPHVLSTWHPYGRVGSTPAVTAEALLSGLPDGATLVVWRATDVAGNPLTLSSVFLVRVDTVPPVIANLTGFPVGVTLDRSATGGFEVRDALSGPDPGGSQVRSHSARAGDATVTALVIEGGAGAAGSWIRVSAELVFAPGGVALQVRARDNASNEALFALSPVFVATPPLLDLKGFGNNSSIPADKDVAIPYNVTDEDGDGWQIQMTVDGATATAGPLLSLRLSPGVHQVAIWVVDDHGLATGSNFSVIASSEGPPVQIGGDGLLALILICSVVGLVVSTLVVRKKRTRTSEGSAELENNE